MQIDENCPLCNENVELVYSTLPGYQEPQTFEIYHCSSCNTSYPLPRCNSGSIYELIYEKGNSVPGYYRYWKYMDEVKREKNPLNYLAEKENTYWAARKAVSEFARKKNNPRILEIGSGLGYLTYSFRKAGYDIIGLDVSETAVAVAKQRYGDYYISGDLFKYSIENAGAFDIVLLTEVIEHIDDITNFISALSKLLQTNGQIIMTTPNKSFYPSNAIWTSDLPPIHCWWLSEETIKYLSNKLGMSVSFIDFSDYYRNNYTPVNIDVNKKISGYRAVFNDEGELVKSKNRNVVNNKFKSMGNSLGKIQIINICYKALRYCFMKLKYIGYSNIRQCGNQTNILCAVLKLDNI
jgi:SAM-dependent methyltransferase